MSRFMDKLLLIFIVFAISAAAFEGFFVKWTFRDADLTPERFSFEAMYEGTAHRPFVHRQLMISVSKGIVEILPQETKEILINKIKHDNFLAKKFKEVDLQDRFLLEYYVVYFLSFLSLFASVFVWRRICIDLTGDSIAGTLAPLAFTIIFPYLETFGGYFYDFSELLFFSLATYFALNGYYLALIFITPLAEYNKESFLFLLLVLFPLLRRKQTTKITIMTLGVSILLALLTYLPIISRFADNAGGMVESHLMSNVIVSVIFAYFLVLYLLCEKIYLINVVASYIVFAILFVLPFILRGSEYPFLFSVFDTFGHTYSVISGERAFLLHIAFILWIIKSAWKFLDKSLKKFSILALGVNTLLILPFGLVFELRNWSLLYPTFIMLIAFYFKDKLKEFGNLPEVKS